MTGTERNPIVPAGAGTRQTSAMPSQTFTFGPEVCGSLDQGGQREWLVPDGRGGYAMGTVSGLRTRRYHGLLVVAGDIPAHRMMGLASLDVVLTRPGGASVGLATHEWASGALSPRGHTLLERCTINDGLPSWRWRVGDVVLERTVAARPGAGGVAVVHTLLAGHGVRVTVEPLCTWRDVHGERHADSGLRAERTADGVVVGDAYRVAGPGFEFDPQWYLGAYHREEAARGLNATEDLLRVGRFDQHLDAGESLEILAWAGEVATPPPPAREVIQTARARAGRLTAAAPDETGGTLALAADAFIVRTATGVDVVAGYPWFGAWSRDTMIAYEGLFLTTGRADEGRELLRSYARTLSGGMLANTADTGQVEHNTADATLWFLHAVDRHVRATGDDDLAAELVGPLDQVVTSHLAGCRYGIVVDPADGLLTQGAPGYALTWMDAVIHGVPVTPRVGKAVELNALWINGLAAVGALRERVGRDRGDLDALRANAIASFVARFPSPRGWLHDVVDGPDGVDASLRPNQLFAFGLPYAPLRGFDAGGVLTAGGVLAAGEALLSPLGPRSLAPRDPGYRGTHRGGPAERDTAYHQGTVWPWLTGPYVDAAKAVGVDTPGVLDGLLGHLAEWGVGSISETADGDAPHRATGCPFQAWSVAEVLRVYRGLR
jgi:predicted glycogen debranching enzyme